ncbi:MAG: hemolysin family protein [Lachnospiraceae bacterium]|nr:hemolysin family protein [Lachnospiraceae bacterium]
MQTTDIFQLIVLIILLLLSGFFSSAETALTTSNRIRMRTLAEEGDKRAARVLAITDDSPKMLSAILIGNNIINLSASSLTTSLTLKLFGSVGVGIATGVLTLLVLIFGEISPKTMATINADKIALSYSGIILFLMKLLTPVIFVVNALSMMLLKLLHVDPNAAANQMTEKELRTIVDVGHENGIIESEEHAIINNVFDFNDAQAKEVMVPRIDMTMVDINNSYEELLEIFREDQFTRIPVYEDSTDNVVGILNIKDLLLLDNKDNFSIRKIMREPFYTYEHKNTAELLNEMKLESTNMAIVLDEYGTTVGLITLEDLIEEIVGEIRDEFEEDEEELTQLNEHEYFVSGSMNLDDLCEALALPFSSEDYDTIGGYLIGLLEHFPKEGESFTTEEDITLRVQKMDKNRIEKIHIFLPEKEKELEQGQD